MSLALSVLGLLLGLLNLLLLYGVIRRLKEIETRPAATAPTGISHGHRLTAGTVLDVPDGTRPTLVAFFAPGCAPCEELLPLVTDRAAREPGGRERVVAVLSEGTAEDDARFAQALAPVARVLTGSPRDPHLAPWFEAFRADGLPLVCGLDETATGMAIGWSAVTGPEFTAKAGTVREPAA